MTSHKRFSRCPSSKSNLNNAQSVKLSSDESKPHCSLSALPDETLLKILKYLDFLTLRRMNQVNKRFNNLTRDFKLYTCLNIRHANLFIYKDVFSYFRHSCKYLKQLDLTNNLFDIMDFVTFIDNCGRRLTQLRLKECFTVNDIVLLNISEICKNLKELDLYGCYEIDDKGFLYLEEYLNSLKNLNLSYTQIQTQRICKILQKNQRMRELHLAPKLDMNLNLNVILVELGRACPDFEAIHLRNTNRFTLQGISALANCKNLRKLIYVNYGHEEPDDCLSKLLSCSQRLEVVFLHGITLTDRILELLTQCKNLERLHLSVMYEDDTTDIYPVIVEHCPKLQEFQLEHCKMSDYFLNL